MERRCLHALFGATAVAACAPAASLHALQGRCDVRSLELVFADPLAYEGQRFCGTALAFPEGISVKLFPAGHDLSERNDLVAFPGAEIEAALLRRNPRGPFEIYLEGRIRPLRRCFRRPRLPDGTPACVPFMRPIDIEVEQHRVLASP